MTTTQQSRKNRNARKSFAVWRKRHDYLPSGVITCHRVSRGGGGGISQENVIRWGCLRRRRQYDFTELVFSMEVPVSKAWTPPTTSAAPANFTKKRVPKALGLNGPPWETCWIFNKIFSKIAEGAIQAQGPGNPPPQRIQLSHTSWKLFVLHQNNGLSCKQTRK